MAGGCGRRGKAQNEEAPNQDRVVHEVIVADLQKQVADSTCQMAKAKYREWSLSDSDSSFENQHHSPIRFREGRERGFPYGGYDFKIELPEFSGLPQAEVFLY
ncbi:hypothetical protein Drorol1_Dr00000722 [Drosera rotundifolia]